MYLKRSVNHLFRQGEQACSTRGKIKSGEIIAFCRQYLAHFKCPASVEFGDLPKNSTGKVQKYVLRGKEWVEHEKRIH